LLKFPNFLFIFFNPWPPSLQLFKRNIVIGHLGGDPELDACGDMGLETPWALFAFTVDDIHFFNYDYPTPELASNTDNLNSMAKGEQ
jgi:hypothetical protein